MNGLVNPFNGGALPVLHNKYNAAAVRHNPFNAAENPAPHAKWDTMNALEGDCRARTAVFANKQIQINGASAVGSRPRTSLQEPPTIFGALCRTLRTIVRLDPEADTQTSQVRRQMNEARDFLQGDVTVLAVQEQGHASELGYMNGFLDAAVEDNYRLGAGGGLDAAVDPKIALIKKYIDTNVAMDNNKRGYEAFMDEDSRVLAVSLKSGDLSLNQAQIYLDLYRDLFRKANPVPAIFPAGILAFQQAVAEERLSKVPAYVRESAKMAGGLLAGALVVSTIGLGALFSTGYFSR